MKKLLRHKPQLLCQPTFRLQELSRVHSHSSKHVTWRDSAKIRKQSLVPLYPRPCAPSATIQSMTGILQCTCLFSARMLPFLALHYPRLCVSCTEIQPLAGILQCTFCLHQFGCYLFWSPSPCILRSLALVPITQRLSDSGPAD